MPWELKNLPVDKSVYNREQVIHSIHKQISFCSYPLVIHLLSTGKSQGYPQGYPQVKEQGVSCMKRLVNSVDGFFQFCDCLSEFWVVFPFL